MIDNDFPYPILVQWLDLPLRKNGKRKNHRKQYDEINRNGIMYVLIFYASTSC